MLRLLTVAAMALLPSLASAQTIVSDPILEADAAQQLAMSREALAVAKQQLATLNVIQALLQAQATRPTADAALGYAARQSAQQAADRSQKLTAEAQK